MLDVTKIIFFGHLFLRPKKWISSVLWKKSNLKFLKVGEVIVWPCLMSQKICLIDFIWYLPEIFPVYLIVLNLCYVCSDLTNHFLFFLNFKVTLSIISHSFQKVPNSFLHALQWNSMPGFGQHPPRTTFPFLDSSNRHLNNLTFVFKGGLIRGHRKLLNGRLRG